MIDWIRGFLIGIAAMSIWLPLHLVSNHEPAEHQHPNIVLCKTKTQTDCLWVDGHADWH